VKDAKIKAVLSKVCSLYALTNILDDNWAGFIDLKTLTLAREAVVELLDAIRPDAIALVDAFDIPDRVINSVLGHSDGNVYEALYEAAKKSPLNLRDPFDGYQEYLRPQLDLEFIKLRNGKIPSHL